MQPPDEQDLSMWSPEMQALIRKTLAQGKELKAMADRMLKRNQEAKRRRTNAAK